MLDLHFEKIKEIKVMYVIKVMNEIKVVYVIKHGCFKISAKARFKDLCMFSCRLSRLLFTIT